MFLNGRFVSESSDILDKDKGLVLGSFAEALKYSPNLITEHFSNSGDQADGISALNTALATDGLFIHVPEGKQLDHPVQLISITDASASIMTMPRSLIILGKNAGLELIEQQVVINDQNPYWNNRFTEISLADGARMEYSMVQTEGDQAVAITGTNVEIGSNSEFTINTIGFGSRVTRNNLNIKIGGEHSVANMNGLYLPKGEQHIDNHTVVDHAVPNCESNELYKGVINNRAKGIFSGKIIVQPHAQKTNAFQSNRNIVLTDHAKANTKPQLEIYADDVKCSHGATTGQLDEEAIFYLQSRGIGKQEAKMLMLKAFAGEVIMNMGCEPLKGALLHRVEKRLMEE